jgi:hypothetical protein
MSDDASSNHADRRKALLARSSEPLHDWSHRDKPPESPDDVNTETSLAQKERVIYLVDDALDTIETVMHTGKDENRLRAAENVLDRAGMTKHKDQKGGESTVDIPAESLVQVIKGLAHVFGASGGSEGPSQGSETINIGAADVQKHTEPAQKAVEPPPKVPKTDKSSSAQAQKEQKEKKKGEKEQKSGLPESLLRQYGGGQ